MGPTSSIESFYVGGSSGALGAWVVRELLVSGAEVVVGECDDRLLRLLLDPDQLNRVHRIADLKAAMRDVTHVVCTSRLTEQECLADPAGSAVSTIGGFVDTLRAAAEVGVSGVGFQGSMSVYAPSAVPVSTSTRPAPTSVHGSYHLAQEILARRYFREFGLPSAGLRTGLVYGPGQEAALDGAASASIAAVVDDHRAQLGYWGIADFQFVGDVALALIAAARDSGGGHDIRNLQGDRATMLAFTQAVAASTGSDQVTTGSLEYPYPVVAYEAEGVLDTLLPAGIRATVETLRWAPKDLYSWN